MTVTEIISERDKIADVGENNRSLEPTFPGTARRRTRIGPFLITVRRRARSAGGKGGSK